MVKLIPLFWKVGGVAALLALLFTISNSLDTQSSQDIQVVLSEQATEVKEGINENSSLINKNLNQDTKDVVKNTESEIVAESKNTKIIKSIAVLRIKFQSFCMIRALSLHILYTRIQVKDGFV